MDNNVQDRINRLNNSEITIEPEWTWKIYEHIQDVMEANKWESEEVIENLSEKLRTIYLLTDLQSTILNDGFFSVFYNESLHKIKQLRRAIDLAGLKVAGDLYDEAFQLVKSKFTWTDEHTNCYSQIKTDPREWFGDEITNRLEEIQDQICGIFFDEWRISKKFEKLLVPYFKS